LVWLFWALEKQGLEQLFDSLHRKDAGDVVPRHLKSLTDWRTRKRQYTDQPVGNDPLGLCGGDLRGAIDLRKYFINRQDLSEDLAERGASCPLEFRRRQLSDSERCGPVTQE
jgi:hypothetical protein